MPLSAWLVGSATIEETTLSVTIDGNADVITVPAGTYYLDDPTDELSLCFALEHAIEDQHSENPSPSVTLSRNRHTRITNNPDIAIQWTSSDEGVILRDLLGYTGTAISGDNEYDSQQISPLLWVPLRPESPTIARLGAQGVPQYDTVFVASSSGAHVESLTYNTRRLNEFRFRFVPNARMWTTPELGGEFVVFHREVLVPGARWCLYRDTLNDEASTTAWSPGTRLGPYKWRPPGGTVAFPYDREIPFVEHLHPVTIGAIVVAEAS